MNNSNNSNNISKPENNSFIANPSLKIDHVHLKVSNLQNLLILPIHVRTYGIRK